MDPIIVITVVGSFITSVSALILGLAGIAAQNKRDRDQAKIDLDKSNKQADLDSRRLDIDKDKVEDELYTKMIENLRLEISRLHDTEDRSRARIVELENDAVIKIKQIGQLMQEGIDKDTTIATMKYKIEYMQVKLNTLLVQEEPAKARLRKKKEDTVPIAFRQELQANEEKKAKISEETDKMIEKFKSGSIANDPSPTQPIEGE